MSGDLDDFINNIQELYSTWSNNLPFATTTPSTDLGNFETIPHSFSIPDRINPQDLLANASHEDVVNQLKQLEVRDFIERLLSITPQFHNTTTKQDLVTTMETTYNELFQVMEPDFIIWSEGMNREYNRQATATEIQRMEQREMREFLVRTQFNDIILGVRRHFGKTYHNTNQLNIRRDHEPERASTVISMIIQHRINISNDVVYARITVNNF